MRNTRQFATGKYRGFANVSRPSELLRMPALPLGICVARDPRRRSDFYDARPAALALQLIKHRPANLPAIAPLADRPSPNIGRNIALNDFPRNPHWWFNRDTGSRLTPAPPGAQFAHG